MMALQELSVPWSPAHLVAQATALVSLVAAGRAAAQEEVETVAPCRAREKSWV
jgi:hypothetical protein